MWQEFKEDSLKLFNKNDGNAEETSKMSNFEECHTDPFTQFLLKNCNLFEYIEYISLCSYILTWIDTNTYISLTVSWP